MFVIQSVLLNKNHFKTRTNASKYIRKNKWAVNVPSNNKEDKTYYRYRQRQPTRFAKGSFKTKKINAYTSFIIGILKK